MYCAVGAGHDERERDYHTESGKPQGGWELICIVLSASATYTLAQLDEVEDCGHHKKCKHKTGLMQQVVTRLAVIQGVSAVPADAAAVPALLSPAL